MALVIHSTLRWVVLGAVGLRALWAAWSLFRQRPHTAPDRASTATAIGLVDLQVLLGILLWLFASPYVQQARMDPGAAMGVDTLRFFFVEHPTMMFLGAVLLHVTSLRARRAATDVAQHRTTLIGFAIGLLCLVGGLPRS